MDLTTPLTSVTPSLDAYVLTVLARSRAALTGMSVARLGGHGSRSGVKLALDRLVDSGLVHAEQAGPAILYRLNREHLLADGVLAMASARSRLEQRLRDRIGNWAVPCVHASLFGSLARNEAGPHSDIDVLVVRVPDLDAGNEDWQSQLTGLEGDVYAWTGNSLSWFETTSEGLARALANEEPVLQSWREDAVHVAGVPLVSLLRQSVSQ